MVVQQRSHPIEQSRVVLRRLVPQPGGTVAADDRASDHEAGASHTLRGLAARVAVQPALRAWSNTQSLLYRRARLPYWIVVVTLLSTVMASLSLSAIFVSHGSSAAASISDSPAALAAAAQANAASATNASAMQDIAGLSDELQQLAIDLERAQRDSDTLRNQTREQADALANTQLGLSSAQEWRSEDDALKSEYQEKLASLQAQLNDELSAIQGRLTAANQSVAAIERRDNDARTALELKTLNVPATDIPDLTTLDDPWTAAGSVLASLTGRVTTVSADLASLQVKAKEQLAKLQSVPAPQPTKAPAAAKTQPQPASAGGSATGRFAWPTNGVITQNYGPSDLSLEPAYLGYAHFHQGLDIANVSYTPILAADGGTVILSGWNGGYGNCVEIDHGNGLITLYGHMVEPSPLRVGQWVDKGQRIGSMGTTGASTGPHLHFAVLRNGTWVDPLAYLP